MPPKKKKKDEEKEKKVVKKQNTTDKTSKKKKNEKEESEKKEKSKVIPTKKVVYAEIDEEVTEVYDKVRSVNAKNVYIVVPKRAVLFQSIVNLKILKRKSEDDNKTVYLITNDKNGLHLAQQIGIEVYNKATGEGTPAIFSAETDDEQLKITPLRATINSVEEQTPKRLAEKKLSISELLGKKKAKKSVDVSKIKSKKTPPQKKEKSKFVLVAPNRHALIGLVVISVFILLVIIYIALPGVTIYLTPSASVLEKSVNITLADYQKNKSELETRPPHMIASYPIETTVDKTITHFATGKKFSNKGVNASGTLTIINTTGNSWPLVARTRFQTEDGIVFRISDPVTVPAATNEGPGTVEVFVTADQVDAYGAIVGERGNIGPARFFLPGLRENSQKKLYAESYNPMTGGVTDYVTYISEEDIEAAKSRLSDELYKSAVEELKSAVISKSELVGESDVYTLLEGEGAIKTGEPKVEIPSGVVGEEKSEFTLSGEIYVSGVYYDHDAMLEILKSELTLKKSPQKELLTINEDSTSYRIFEWDDNSGKIKLTANIKGIEQFAIDPDQESGERLLNKIKEHVAGKDIEEAKLYIQNLPQINKVEIESWPAWSPTIPNITDNIKFEIRNAMRVE
ncbi:hypothetical protein GF366_03580 [Candidatus Peregrinibacteria bacterium]|nr:hypothetical protein [Candidatus Peregrinibacteria bacterium]